MPHNTISSDLKESSTICKNAIADPRWYDRVPAIIDYLTYIDEVLDKATGEILFFRKRLTSTEKDLYRVLCQKAIDGSSFYGCRTLASQMGCSKDTVNRAQRVLELPFEQLDGNSLIEITEKQVLRSKGNAKFGVTQNVITINHIWTYNNYFSVNKPKTYPSKKQKLTAQEAEIVFSRMADSVLPENVHKDGARLKLGTSRGGSSQTRDKPREGSSQTRDIYKPTNNKPTCLKTDLPEANALARCLLTSSLVEKEFASQASSFEWLQKFGFKENVARGLLRENSPDQLLLAACYVRDALKGKKEIASITGYFRKALMEKWYIPKVA